MSRHILCRPDIQGAVTMRIHKPAGIILFFTLSLALPSVRAGTVPQHDIPGSHDSAIVSRFPGSTIIGFQSADYDQASFPTGAKLKDGARLAQAETVSGRVTRIAYAVPANKSAYEVYQNYHAALARAGFVAKFQCSNDSCGDRFDMSNAVSTSDIQNAMAHDRGSEYGNAMIDLLWCNGGDLYITTSHLARPQGNVDLSLLVCRNSDFPTGVLLQTVEEKPMATGEITVDAKAMGQGLAQNGHIALYGIHFATDSANLMPDSDAQLQQMAALLKARPKLKVFIVGHTDDTGSLAHNLALSQQRAESVVKALATGHGIAAARMAAKGVASYAPVASNHTDAGRAKNRRVELVEQ